MVVLLRCRLQYSLFRPILPSLHRPLGALGSNPPLAGTAFGWSYRQPALKGEVANEVSRRGYKLARSSLLVSTPQSIRLAAYCQLPGRGAFWGGTICQDIRVNAQVGTRSPYSLPFVILPVPARSPFRFIRHWRRSTPNLAASPTGRARLESPASGGAFGAPHKLSH